MVSDKDSSKSLNGMRTIRKILRYQKSIFFFGKMIRREGRWQKTEEWQGNDDTKSGGQNVLKKFGSEGKVRDDLGGQESFFLRHGEPDLVCRLNRRSQ